MAENVFAYGELMKKDRLMELINRIPEMKKGKIIGYEKFFDKSIGYYGVRKKEKTEKRKNNKYTGNSGNNKKIENSVVDSVVEGIVLLNISKDELKIFDDYEDEGIYYFREKTMAYCEDGKYEVYVYLRCR